MQAATNAHECLGMYACAFVMRARFLSMCKCALNLAHFQHSFAQHNHKHARLANSSVQPNDHVTNNQNITWPYHKSCANSLSFCAAQCAASKHATKEPSGMVRSISDPFPFGRSVQFGSVRFGLVRRLSVNFGRSLCVCFVLFSLIQCVTV